MHSLTYKSIRIHIHTHTMHADTGDKLGVAAVYVLVHSCCVLAHTHTHTHTHTHIYTYTYTYTHTCT